MSRLMVSLSPKELHYLAKHRPDWMAEHFPDWMCNNHPEWMSNNWPEWMAEFRPSWIADNRPEWMATYHPRWMSENRFDWMSANRAELMRAYTKEYLSDDIEKELALLDGHTIVTGVSVNTKDRRAKWREEKDKFIEETKALMASKYGLARNEVFDKAWDIAWRWGHSYSLEKVDEYFKELVELIEAVKKSLASPLSGEKGK